MRQALSGIGDVLAIYENDQQRSLRSTARDLRAQLSTIEGISPSLLNVQQMLGTPATRLQTTGTVSLSTQQNQPDAAYRQMAEQPLFAGQAKGKKGDSTNILNSEVIAKLSEEEFRRRVEKLNEAKDIPHLSALIKHAATHQLAIEAFEQLLDILEAFERIGRSLAAADDIVIDIIQSDSYAAIHALRIQFSSDENDIITNPLAREIMQRRLQNGDIARLYAEGKIEPGDMSLILQFADQENILQLRELTASDPEISSAIDKALAARDDISVETPPDPRLIKAIALLEENNEKKIDREKARLIQELGPELTFRGAEGFVEEIYRQAAKSIQDKATAARLAKLLATRAKNKGDKTEAAKKSAKSKTAKAGSKAKGKTATRAHKTAVAGTEGIDFIPATLTEWMEKEVRPFQDINARSYMESSDYQSDFAAFYGYVRAKQIRITDDSFGPEIDAFIDYRRQREIDWETDRPRVLPADADGNIVRLAPNHQEEFPNLLEEFEKLEEKMRGRKQSVPAHDEVQELKMDKKQEQKSAPAGETLPSVTFPALSLVKRALERRNEPQIPVEPELSREERMLQDHAEIMKDVRAAGQKFEAAERAVRGFDNAKEPYVTNHRAIPKVLRSKIDTANETLLAARHEFDEAQGRRVRSQRSLLQYQEIGYASEFLAGNMEDYKPRLAKANIKVDYQTIDEIEGQHLLEEFDRKRQAVVEAQDLLYLVQKDRYILELYDQDTEQIDEEIKDLEEEAKEAKEALAEIEQKLDTILPHDLLAAANHHLRLMETDCATAQRNYLSYVSTHPVLKNLSPAQVKTNLNEQLQDNFGVQEDSKTQASKLVPLHKAIEDARANLTRAVNIYLRLRIENTLAEQNAPEYVRARKTLDRTIQEARERDDFDSGRDALDYVVGSLEKEYTRHRQVQTGRNKGRVAISTLTPDYESTAVLISQPSSTSRNIVNIFDEKHWCYRGPKKGSKDSEYRMSARVIAHPGLIKVMDALAKSYGFKYKVPNSAFNWNRIDPLHIYLSGPLTPSQKREIALALEPFVFQADESEFFGEEILDGQGNSIAGVRCTTTPSLSQVAELIAKGYEISPQLGMAIKSRFEIGSIAGETDYSPSPGKYESIQRFIERLLTTSQSETVSVLNSRLVNRIDRTTNPSRLYAVVISTIDELQETLALGDAQDRENSDQLEECIALRAEIIRARAAGDPPLPVLERLGLIATKLSNNQQQPPQQTQQQQQQQNRQQGQHQQEQAPMNVMVDRPRPSLESPTVAEIDPTGQLIEDWLELNQQIEEASHQFIGPIARSKNFNGDFDAAAQFVRNNWHDEAAMRQALSGIGDVLAIYENEQLSSLRGQARDLRAQLSAIEGISPSLLNVQQILGTPYTTPAPETKAGSPASESNGLHQRNGFPIEQAARQPHFSSGAEKANEGTRDQPAKPLSQAELFASFKELEVQVGEITPYASPLAESASNEYTSQHWYQGPLPGGFRAAAGHDFRSRNTFFTVDPENDPVLAAIFADADIRFRPHLNDKPRLARMLTRYADDLMSPEEITAEDWDKEFIKFLYSHTNKVIPIGLMVKLRIGTCVPQSLLLKTLADRFELDFILMTGSFSPPDSWTEDHSWCVTQNKDKTIIYDPARQKYGVPLEEIDGEYAITPGKTADIDQKPIHDTDINPERALSVLAKKVEDAAKEDAGTVTQKDIAGMAQEPGKAKGEAKPLKRSPLADFDFKEHPLGSQQRELTVAQAASILQVSTNTIRRWADNGVFAESARERTGTHHDRHIPESALVKFMRRYSMEALLANPHTRVFDLNEIADICGAEVREVEKWIQEKENALKIFRLPNPQGDITKTSERRIIEADLKQFLKEHGMSDRFLWLNKQPPRLYKPGEIVKLFKISAVQVAEYIKAKSLKAHRFPSTPKQEGHSRVSHPALMHFLAVEEQKHNSLGLALTAEQRDGVLRDTPVLKNKTQLPNINNGKTIVLIIGVNPSAQAIKREAHADDFLDGLGCAKYATQMGSSIDKAAVQPGLYARAYAMPASLATKGSPQYLLFLYQGSEDFNPENEDALESLNPVAVYRIPAKQIKSSAKAQVSETSPAETDVATPGAIEARRSPEGSQRRSKAQQNADAIKQGSRRVAITDAVERDHRQYAIWQKYLANYAKGTYGINDMKRFAHYTTDRSCAKAAIEFILLSKETDRIKYLLELAAATDSQVSAWIAIERLLLTPIKKKVRSAATASLINLINQGALLRLCQSGQMNSDDLFLAAGVAENCAPAISELMTALDHSPEAKLLLCEEIVAPLRIVAYTFQTSNRKIPEAMALDAFKYIIAQKQDGYAMIVEELCLASHNNELAKLARAEAITIWDKEAESPDAANDPGILLNSRALREFVQKLGSQPWPNGRDLSDLNSQFTKALQEVRTLNSNDNDFIKYMKTLGNSEDITYKNWRDKSRDEMRQLIKDDARYSEYEKLKDATDKLEEIKAEYLPLIEQRRQMVMPHVERLCRQLEIPVPEWDTLAIFEKESRNGEYWLGRGSIWIFEKLICEGKFPGAGFRRTTAHEIRHCFEDAEMMCDEADEMGLGANFENSDVLKLLDRYVALGLGDKEIFNLQFFTDVLNLRPPKFNGKRLSPERSQLAKQLKKSYRVSAEEYAQRVYREGQIGELKEITKHITDKKLLSEMLKLPLDECYAKIRHLLGFTRDRVPTHVLFAIEVLENVEEKYSEINPEHVAKAYELLQQEIDIRVADLELLNYKAYRAKLHEELAHKVGFRAVVYALVLDNQPANDTSKTDLHQTPARGTDIRPDGTIVVQSSSERPSAFSVASEPPPSSSSAPTGLPQSGSPDAFEREIQVICSKGRDLFETERAINTILHSRPTNLAQILQRIILSPDASENSVRRGLSKLVENFSDESLAFLQTEAGLAAWAKGHIGTEEIVRQLTTVRETNPVPYEINGVVSTLMSILDQHPQYAKLKEELCRVIIGGTNISRALSPLIYEETKVAALNYLFSQQGQNHENPVEESLLIALSSRPEEQLAALAIRERTQRFTEQPAAEQSELLPQQNILQLVNELANNPWTDNAHSLVLRDNLQTINEEISAVETIINSPDRLEKGRSAGLQQRLAKLRRDEKAINLELDKIASARAEELNRRLRSTAVLLDAGLPAISFRTSTLSNANILLDRNMLLTGNSLDRVLISAVISHLARHAQAASIVRYIADNRTDDNITANTITASLAWQNFCQHIGFDAGNVFISNVLTARAGQVLPDRQARKVEACLEACQRQAEFSKKYPNLTAKIQALKDMREKMRSILYFKHEFKTQDSAKLLEAIGTLLSPKELPPVRHNKHIWTLSTHLERLEDNLLNPDDETLDARKWDIYVDLKEVLDHRISELEKTLYFENGVRYAHEAEIEAAVEAAHSFARLAEIERRTSGYSPPTPYNPQRWQQQKNGIDPAASGSGPSEKGPSAETAARPIVDQRALAEEFIRQQMMQGEHGTDFTPPPDHPTPADLIPPSGISDLTHRAADLKELVIAARKQAKAARTVEGAPALPLTAFIPVDKLEAFVIESAEILARQWNLDELDTALNIATSKGERAFYKDVKNKILATLLARAGTTEPEQIKTISDGLIRTVQKVVEKSVNVFAARHKVPETRDDLRQEVVLKVLTELQKPGVFKLQANLGRHKFAAFVHTITKHALLDMARRWSRKSRQTVSLDFDFEQKTPDRQSAIDRLDRVSAELEKLPDSYRLPFQMRYRLGDYQEDTLPAKRQVECRGKK